MNIQHFSLLLVVPLLSLTVVLAFIRFMRGPSLADRVVALDLMSTVGMGVIAIYSIWTGKPVFLDVAIILALVTFLGTVGFAYYMERRSAQERA